MKPESAIWRRLQLALALTAAAAALAGCGSSAGADRPLAVEAGGGAAVAEAAAPASGQDGAGSGFETLAFPSNPPVPARTVKLPILMFHHVGEAPPGADQLRRNLTVSGADFEAQMSYLKQAGYQPVSESQLYKALFAGEALPPRPVMLTLDDGYLDNYTVAAPILKKYGFTATFYVITDFLGSGDYMSWEQVMDLERQGMDIGSHTSSHQDLTILSGADLSRELKGSAAVLASRLGHPVYWLCYPAGKYDADVVRVSREAGYLLATTTQPGETQSSDAPLTLLRYRVRSDTGLEEFKQLVE